MASTQLAFVGKIRRAEEALAAEKAAAAAELGELVQAILQAAEVLGLPVRGLATEPTAPAARKRKPRARKAATAQPRKRAKQRCTICVTEGRPDEQASTHRRNQHDRWVEVGKETVTVGIVGLTGEDLPHPSVGA